MVPGTEFARDFCAGVGPLQLDVVLGFLYIYFSFLSFTFFWAVSFATRRSAWFSFILNITPNLLIFVELRLFMHNTHPIFFSFHFTPTINNLITIGVAQLTGCSAGNLKSISLLHSGFEPQTPWLRIGGSTSRTKRPLLHKCSSVLNSTSGCILWIS